MYSTVTFTVTLYEKLRVVVVFDTVVGITRPDDDGAAAAGTGQKRRRLIDAAGLDWTLERTGWEWAACWPAGWLGLMAGLDGWLVGW